MVTNKRQGGATPDLARLFGCRLVTINETENADHLNESRVKFITSSDIITARNLYEKLFDFVPTHKTILTTNHRPIVRGTDEGIWRRIHLWPFTTTIPESERDKNFRDEKLLPELAGILNWALEGLTDYLKFGLRPPPSVLNATQDYRGEMDIIGRWIEDAASSMRRQRIPTAKLYVDYDNWARGEIGFTTSTIAFGRDLSDRGFNRTKVKVKENWVRGIRGLKIRTQEYLPPL